MTDLDKIYTVMTCLHYRDHPLFYYVSYAPISDIWRIVLSWTYTLTIYHTRPVPYISHYIMPSPKTISLVLNRLTLNPFFFQIKPQICDGLQSRGYNLAQLCGSPKSQ